MTPRQLPVSRFLQDGENPRGDGSTTAAREGAMAVCSMPALQGMRAALRPNFHRRRKAGNIKAGNIKAGNTNKRSPKQRVAHGRTCACV